jgi:EAL domain-containing protein (putative c-di-GMP-specific phosphodiesterase class I)
VETVEHEVLLMNLGCDVAQGYGIANPMPVEKVLSWVAKFVLLIYLEG